MQRTVSPNLETALEQAAPTRAQWSAWVRREPSLAGLTYEDLRRELRTAGQDLKDKLLGAVVRVTHADRGAFIVVAGCLLPALRYRIARYAPTLDRQEAFSVMACGLVEAVDSFDAGERSQFVASALLALPTRRLRRAALEQRRWSAHAHHDSEAATGAPGPELPARAMLASAVNAGVVTDQDAQLILDTRIRGRSLHDAARRLGLRYEAAKKRRQRAETRWASWWTNGGTQASPRPDVGPLRGDDVA